MMYSNMCDVVLWLTLINVLCIVCDYVYDVLQFTCNVLYVPFVL